MTHGPCTPASREPASSTHPAVQTRRYRSRSTDSTSSEAPSTNSSAHSPALSPASAGCAVFQMDQREALILSRLSFRTSVFCAVRNLGEPREASRSLRRNDRAFGSLPYRRNSALLLNTMLCPVIDALSGPRSEEHTSELQ